MVEVLPLLVSVRIAVIIDFFDVVAWVVFGGFEFFNDLTKEGLIVVDYLERLHALEERCLVLLHPRLRQGAFVGSRRTPFLPRCPSFLQQLLELLIAHHELRKSLRDGRAHYPPLARRKLQRPQQVRIVEVANRGLDGEGVGNAEMLEHNCAGSLLLLLVDGEGAAVEPEVGV